MRSLVLLSLVALAFLLVLKFYPTSEADGAERNGLEPAGEARFLPRPDPSHSEPSTPAPRPEVSRPTETVSTPPEPRADDSSERATSSWLAGIEKPVGVDEGEVEIAATLLHGSPRDVDQALRRAQGFPEERARLVRAFSLAIHEPEQGYELAATLNANELHPRERSLIQAALRGSGGELVSDLGTSGSPLQLAMEMAVAALEAQALLDAKQYAEAALLLSDLLQTELDAPWQAAPATLAAWTELLDRAQRSHRWSARGAWASDEITVEPNDSLVSVRKRYLGLNPERVICTGLIARANGLTGSIIQPGQVLRVPTDPVQVLVDLEARWALYMIGNEVAGSWPVGIGRTGEETPPGEYVAKDKLENPPWMKVGQAPIPYGDVRNPLGTRWIGWYRDGVKTSYGFHGTVDPESIGSASSDGCVRFLNEDIELLFTILPEGAEILVRG